MDEIFREIAGYEGLYQVSNLGNVISLNYNRTGQTRILKSGKHKLGYLLVVLCKDGEMKTHKVHRLVAQAFIDNPDNLPEINHIDEDKTNNRVDNLEWCHHKYNMTYGTRIERQAEAMTNGKLSKKVLQLTLDGKIVREWASTHECERNGFNQGNVSMCCLNKYCSQGNVYKGFRWMFAKDYYKQFVA